MIGTLEHVDLVSQEQETNRDKTQGNLPEHLKELVEKCSSSLTLENKQKLIELLVEYQDIFVGPDGMLGQTDVVKHKINTGSAKPVKTPPRRISPKQKEIVEKELESMLKKGVIEPSNSSWSSPICLFRKGTQHSNADGLSRIPARKCKKDDCKQCFPDSIVQSQTEENANCRICNRIHPGSCPAVMTEENSLLNTIVCSVIDNTPDQNLDPNWLDFWSMEEIKNMQEEDPAIGDMLRLKNNQDEKPLRIDILNLHPEAKVLWGMWENLEVMPRKSKKSKASIAKEQKLRMRERRLAEEALQQSTDIDYIERKIFYTVNEFTVNKIERNDTVNDLTGE
ncbi:unnamed protein product [Mytilus edulis]|uniref:Uncharacterized protein n=1 Tax=Mytilus edulis TaxID=6550 RepID=A0A8S3UQV1_MYTED|nr:unnamed protein product [Mytilus edulis]